MFCMLVLFTGSYLAFQRRFSGLGVQNDVCDGNVCGDRLDDRSFLAKWI